MTSPHDAHASSAPTKRSSARVRMARSSSTLGMAAKRDARAALGSARASVARASRLARSTMPARVSTSPWRRRSSARSRDAGSSRGKASGVSPASRSSSRVAARVRAKLGAPATGAMNGVAPAARASNTARATSARPPSVDDGARPRSAMGAAARMPARPSNVARNTPNVGLFRALLRARSSRARRPPPSSSTSSALGLAWSAASTSARRDAAHGPTTTRSERGVSATSGEATSRTISRGSDGWIAACARPPWEARGARCNAPRGRRRATRRRPPCPRAARSRCARG